MSEKIKNLITIHISTIQNTNFKTYRLKYLIYCRFLGLDVVKTPRLKMII
jgi:hypothetical protein